MDVQQFLKNMRFTATGDAAKEGTTWLEMYILYKMQGGRCCAQAPGPLAIAQPHMRQHVCEFKGLVRKIARLTMEEEDAKIFQASESKYPRLKRLGIANHVPMMCLRIAVHPQASDYIVREVIKSQGRKTAKEIDCIISGEKQIEEKNLSMKGRTRWSRSIRKVAFQIWAGVEEDRGRQVAHDEEGQRPEGGARGSLDLFKCPRCERWASAGRKAFSIENIGARTWCNSCKTNHMVKEWLCECRKPWFACSLHKGLPDSLRARRSLQAVGEQKGKRRRRQTPSASESDEGSATGAKAVQYVQFTKKELNVVQKRARPALLSLGLKRKFPHLLRQGGCDEEG